MKTAISIPTPLFKAADRLSRRLGLSRSALYAQAVKAFLKSHQGKGVKEALDAIYASEDSRLDSALEKMQQASVPRED